MSRVQWMEAPQPPHAICFSAIPTFSAAVLVLQVTFYLESDNKKQLKMLSL